jgi:predicted RNA-binding Zn-ribbon protein involved in translation (DUF1610 family)
MMHTSMTVLPTNDRYACPACGIVINAQPAPQRQQLICPDCGTEFVIPAIGEDDSAVDIDLPAELSMTLDRARISDLTDKHRQRQRSTTPLLITIVLCLAGCVQLSLILVRRAGDETWSNDLTATAIAAAVLLMVSVIMVLKVSRTPPPR